MKITSDIFKKIFVIDQEDLESYRIELKFAFRDNDKLPVIFDKLKFGYSIKLENEIVDELVMPQPHAEYISTDQDLLEHFVVTDLLPTKEYTLNVWSENSENFWNDSFSFTLPIPKKPYPSWVYNEELFAWVAPKPYPTDGDEYIWDETLKNWKLIKV